MPDDATICVYVIDDDASVRRALEMLLFSAGMKVLTYDSAETFLESGIREHGTCVIADFKMKGLGGLGLRKQLINKGICIPIIFLTDLDSKEDRKQAIKSGAMGFFRKPVDDQALLDTIRWSLSSSSVSEE